MIHTAELDLDQFREPTYDPRFDFGVFGYFENYGYPIDGVLEAHNTVHVKQESENTGHIVAKIHTLEKPTEMADAVEDKHIMWVCDCKDYQFNQGVDLDERFITDWGTCKHIQSVAKEERAKNDKGQATL